MKRFVALSVLMLLLIPSQALAKYDQTHKRLKDSAGTAILDYALTSGAAKYSETINVEKNAGFSVLLITEDKAGGAGDVDISAEYSVDGSTWHTAYTTNMSGTVSAEGNIVTALQNVTRWIIFTPRVSKYMRYKFDPDADSQVTAYHIFVEDK